MSTFDWDKSIMRVAEFLATDEGKNEYRSRYRSASATWLSEPDLTRAEALATARADALVDVIASLGIDPEALDRDLCACDQVDSRVWARSTNPENIARGLSRFIYRPCD